MARTLRLHPDACPARRGPGEVQFGLFPDCGIVLSGLSEAESDLLLGLRESVTELDLHARARRLGVAADRLAQALQLLREHGLLESAPDPVTPTGTVPVTVEGVGPLAEHIRRQLAGAGMPVLASSDDRLPGLLVRVARGALPLRPTELPDPAPVLPVVARACGVVLGPVVGAGPGPCLRCVELHRVARDGARPQVLAQVAPLPLRGGRDGGRWTDRQGGLDPALMLAATGLVVLLTHSLLRTQAPPVGMAWELCPPWPDVVVRRWSVHPACGCQG